MTYRGGDKPALESLAQDVATLTGALVEHGILIKAKDAKFKISRKLRDDLLDPFRWKYKRSELRNSYYKPAFSEAVKSFLKARIKHYKLASTDDKAIMGVVQKYIEGKKSHEYNESAHQGISAAILTEIYHNLFSNQG